MRGAPFTKAKAAADFPAVVDLLPTDADADSDKFVAVQVPVALLLRGENPAPHGKKADEVRPMFVDHGDAAAAWYNAHRAHTSVASATLLATAADMGAYVPPTPGTEPVGRGQRPDLGRAPPTTTSSRPSRPRWPS